MPGLVQQFDHDRVMALGTLAAATAVLSNTKIDTARENGFRVTKSRYFFSLTQKTTTEGPISVGICIGLDAAGVKAALEADPQTNIADDARGEGTYIKKLFTIGVGQQEFPGSGGSGMDFMRGIEVSYGKNGWSVPEGSLLAVWAYNQDGTALTTGCVINWDSEHFGVWLRD